MLEITVDASKIRDDALKRWIEQYQTALTRICYLNLKDLQLAEDAVQETFIRAYLAYGKSGAPRNERAWLNKIALNQCRDMLRGAWLRRVDRRITPEDLPERIDAAEQSDLEITAAVMNLPRKQLEVVILYYYQGFSIVETASILNISQPSVSARLKRARDMLRAALKEDKVDESE